MLILEAVQLATQAFFKPFKLDEELKATSPYLRAGSPLPDRDVQNGMSPDERRVVNRVQAAVALVILAWPIVCGLGALWLGYKPQGIDLLFVALTSLFFGAVALQWISISFAVNIGGAVSLAGSLIAILAHQATQGIGVIGSERLATILMDPASQKISIIVIGLGLISGLILGLAVIATFTLRQSAWWFVGVSVTGGSLLLVARFTYASSKSLEHIVASAILAGLFALGFLSGHMLGYRRLPFYLVELIWQVVLSGLSWLVAKIKRRDSGRLVRQLYQLSPVRVDELIWFQLWSLDRQLAWMALGGEREYALETIVKIARSFRQGWAAEAALAAIIAHDLRECRSIPEIAKAAPQLNWFPRAIDLPSRELRRTVTLLNEVSQSAEAAGRTPDPSVWQENLGQAQDNLKALQKTLDEMGRRAANPLNRLVRRWEKAVEEGLKSVPPGAASVRIENIYIAGNPIQPEHKRVLVGREDLFAKIQEDLTAAQKPTLVLHGQRRTGKTSLLLQLPSRLSARYIPVYVDLQATARVERVDLNRFLYTLARETVHQAHKNRQIELLSVELEDLDRRGIHAFYEWLEETRQRLEGRLLLLALDEFEKIEEAIEKGTLDEAVLDVLRHLVQHHSPWLVLLFAGVRTLEEMSRDWHSYFISVRPLHVSYLDPEAARKLILLPTETYPIQYDEPAIEAILEATHAQPFLLQDVCSELTFYLNSSQRHETGPLGRVTLTDVRTAIDRALRSAQPYFFDLWDRSSESERILLAKFAYRQEEFIQLDELDDSQSLSSQQVHQTIEKLIRRELIERERNGCRFQVPMMRRWIQDEVSREQS